MEKDRLTILSAKCSKTTFTIETIETVGGTEFESIYYYYEKNNKVEDNVTKDILLKTGVVFVYPGCDDNYGI